MKTTSHCIVQVRDTARYLLASDFDLPDSAGVMRLVLFGFVTSAALAFVALLFNLLPATLASFLSIWPLSVMVFFAILYFESIADEKERGGTPRQ